MLFEDHSGANGFSRSFFTVYIQYNIVLIGDEESTRGVSSRIKIKVRIQMGSSQECVNCFPVYEALANRFTVSVCCSAVGCRCLCCSQYSNVQCRAKNASTEIFIFAPSVGSHAPGSALTAFQSRNATPFPLIVNFAKPLADKSSRKYSLSSIESLFLDELFQLHRTSKF